MFSNDVIMIRQKNGLYIQADDCDSLPYLFEKCVNVKSHVPITCRSFAYQDPNAEKYFKELQKERRYKKALKTSHASNGIR